MSAEFLLLANEVFKNYILTQPPAAKRILKEKLEFLANGLWDSGVRVKKLRGLSNKTVFEARVSRGDRLLFTLGRQGAATAIYLWGVAGHDRVSGRAGDILPDNAPFLRFEPYETEERPSLELDALAPELYTQERLEDKAQEEYAPQKWLVLGEEQWERLLQKADPDSLEIYLYLTEEQAAVLNMPPPLLLSGTAGSGKTTISVYYLLRPEFAGRRRLFVTYNPFLLRFSERIYRGLTKNTVLESPFGEPRPPRPRGTRPSGADTGPAADHGPVFRVFRDLLYEILESSGRRPAPEGLVDLEGFDRIFRQHSLYRRYDTELVWEEIRSIIKGAKPPVSPKRFRELAGAYGAGSASRDQIVNLQDYLLWLKPLEIADKVERIIEKRALFADYDGFVDSLGKPAQPQRDQAASLLAEILKTLEKRASAFASPLLSLQEYLLLGRKRAPNFLYDREDIHCVAAYYQERLAAQGLHDEIDLCRQALGVLEENPGALRYELVVCDEVQDFCDLQIALILKLADPFHHVVLTGDPRQMINPSGFRWEEVRQRFYERGVAVPPVKTLSLNFRCVGSIVTLANALLDLKQRLVGLSGSELRERWKFQGQPPCLVEGVDEEAVLERIRLTGAGRIVLVRGEDERDRLKKRLGTELVFTIYEAKGLEFDAALLWKFTEEGKSPDIWRRILAGQPLDPARVPHVRHELNLLYVAVTRARNTLLVYDGAKLSDLWQLESLGELCFRSREEADLTRLWQRVSTAAQWEAQGEYFFEREHYPAAAECFRNAGDEGRMLAAQGYVFRAQGDHARAAELFEAQGLSRQAAQCLEQAGLFSRAAALWAACRQKKRSRVCHLKAWEQEGRYAEAAEGWEALKDFEAALRNWDKAGQPARAAAYYEARKDYLKAARLYEQAGKLRHAAKCFRRAGQAVKAAELLFRGEHWAEAARLYAALKDKARLLACYDKLGDDYAAGRLHEKQGAHSEAVACYRRYAGASESNRRRLEEEAEGFCRSRRTLKAALRYSALGRHGEAAELFFERKLFALARSAYREAGDALKAAECLALQGQHREAAQEIEALPLSDEPAKWQRVRSELKQHLFAGRSQWSGVDRSRAQAVYGEAAGFLARGEPERALVRYQAINYLQGVAEVCSQQKWDEPALRYFFEVDQPGFALEYMHSRGEDFRATTGLVEWLADELGPAERVWELDETIEVAAGILLSALERGPAAARRTAEGVSDRLLGDLEHSLPFLPQIPDALLSLLLLRKAYAPLFRILQQRPMAFPNMAEEMADFLTRLREQGEREEDRSLLACCYYLTDRERYEELLADLPVDARNVAVFSESREHYRKAVDHWLGGAKPLLPDVQEAAMLCHNHGDPAEAAAIYERFGMLKQAGREYLAAARYAEALRCCEAIGDRQGQARVYERMGELQKAAEIWSDLGRTRELARLERKRKQRLRDAGSSGQMDLFGSPPASSR